MWILWYWKVWCLLFWQSELWGQSFMVSFQRDVWSNTYRYVTFLVQMLFLILWPISVWFLVIFWVSLSLPRTPACSQNNSPTRLFRLRLPPNWHGFMAWLCPLTKSPSGCSGPLTSENKTQSHFLSGQLIHYIYMDLLSSLLFFKIHGWSNEDSFCAGNACEKVQ